jgi:hypothetical protein
MVTLAAFTSLFLPSVNRTVYFHRKRARPCNAYSTDCRFKGILPHKRLFNCALAHWRQNPHVNGSGKKHSIIKYSWVEWMYVYLCVQCR